MLAIKQKLICDEELVENPANVVTLRSTAFFLSSTGKS